MPRTVLLYRDADGTSDVEDFLAQLSPKARAKCTTYMRLLEGHELPLPRNYAAHVRGSIWELRPEYGGTEYRLLYSPLPSQRFVILHAFVKKRRQLREEDIVRAENRLADLERRIID
jgi:phage-related protein